MYNIIEYPDLAVCPVSSHDIHVMPKYIPTSLNILYFLEISPQQDFISKPHLMWQQFEGGVYRDQHTHIHSFNNKPICLSPLKLEWKCLGDCGELARAPVDKAGGPGFDSWWLPWFFFSFSWLPNVDGMKDLWCSSTVRLLSTQIWMEKSMVL